MPEQNKSPKGGFLETINGALGVLPWLLNSQGQISVTKLLSGEGERQYKMAQTQAQLQQLQLEDIMAKQQQAQALQAALPGLRTQAASVTGQPIGNFEYNSPEQLQALITNALSAKHADTISDENAERDYLLKTKAQRNQADLTRGNTAYRIKEEEKSQLVVDAERRARDKADALPGQKALFNAQMAQDPTRDTRVAKAIALGGQTAINALYPTQAADSRTSDEKNVDAILKAQEAGDYKKANMLLNAMSNKGNVLAVGPDGTVISGSGQAAADMMKNIQIRGMYEKARGNLTLLDGLRDMRLLIRRDTTGIYGVLGNTLQNVKQLNPQIGAQVESLQVEAEAIIANSPDIVEFRTGFNPDIPALKVAALATAIKYAQANNAGRAPTDNDVKLAMKVVGSPEGWLTNPAEMIAGMDQLEKATRREHQRELDGMRLFGVDPTTIKSLEPPKPAKMPEVKKAGQVLKMWASGNAQRRKLAADMLRANSSLLTAIDPQTGAKLIPDEVIIGLTDY